MRIEKENQKKLMFWSTTKTSLGELLLASTNKGICRISFNEGYEQLSKRFLLHNIRKSVENTKCLINQVAELVENPISAPPIETPIDRMGTAFQRAVWDQLRKIPMGETRTYKDIAKGIDNPLASRAVGNANRSNGLAVLVPCHRVVPAKGSFGGYAYGSSIKKELLKREGAIGNLA